ncbi:MAG: hypothetical protein KA125_06445 [Chromatiaceae bacterium]|nr:hypothetical protein [Chromatiaceae bacterium]
MAISPIQFLANQLNALRATGPRTAAGKAVSSANARKHGILSRQLIIEGESAEDFGALLEALLADEAPVGTLECALVERLAIGLWRQRRAVTAESASLHLQRLALAEPEWLVIQQLCGADLDLIRATLADGLTVEAAEGVGEAFAAWQAVPDADKPQDLAALEARFPLLLELLQGIMSVDAALLVELGAPGSESESGAASLGDLLATRCAGSLTDCLAFAQEHFLRQMAIRRAAGHLRAARLLPAASEQLARYQSALDNELYKVIKALREAQTRRRALSVLDAVPVGEGG